MVRIGEAGNEHQQQGAVEITDIVFTTVGPAPGAIVVEWNARNIGSEEDKPGGMWDSHIRLVKRFNEDKS